LGGLSQFAPALPVLVAGGGFARSPFFFSRIPRVGLGWIWLRGEVWLGVGEESELARARARVAEWLYYFPAWLLAGAAPAPLGRVVPLKPAPLGFSLHLSLYPPPLSHFPLLFPSSCRLVPACLPPLAAVGGWGRPGSDACSGAPPGLRSPSRRRGLTWAPRSLRNSCLLGLRISPPVPATRLAPGF
jgi:hypothetical protein